MKPPLKRKSFPRNIVMGFALTISLLISTRSVISETTSANANQVISLRQDPVGELLRTWEKEGKIAGHEGDLYDNRDDGHSSLNPAFYPKLKRVIYTEQEKSANHHRGPALIIRPSPTLGNCSMAAPRDRGGSLPRLMMGDPKGLQFLFGQYFSNQFYVYPEHEDHDAPFGDLIPFNQPFVLLSQGSSGTDQPFVQAWAAAMAALKPEIKEKLVRERMLMPVLQALFRQTTTLGNEPSRYLTGEAHPSVFEANTLDEKAFVQAAHALTEETMPPVTVLKVISNPTALRGIDYFEGPELASETWADAGAVIARVYRSKEPTRQWRLQANHWDVKGRPCRTVWKVLRGEAKITPIGDGQSVLVEVPWQNRFHVPGRNDLHTSRVDVACFAENGTSVSAPAFLSVTFSPHEVRFYEEVQGKKRLVSADYAAEWVDPGWNATDSLAWSAVWTAAAGGEAGFATQLSQWVSEETKERLRQKREPILKALGDIATARENQKNMPENATEAYRTQVLSQLEQALKAWDDLLNAGLKQELIEVLNHWKSLPNLVTERYAECIRVAEAHGRQGALAEYVQRLIQKGILEQTSNGAIRWKAGKNRLGDGYYEKNLNQVALTTSFFPNLDLKQALPPILDARFFSLKDWRDEGVYNEKGEALGWLRWRNGRAMMYLNQGQRVTSYSAQGQVQGVNSVSYSRKSAQEILTESIVE